MKVYGIPYCRDLSSASARIRYHRMISHMEGIEVVETLGECDLVYIQKSASNIILSIAKDAASMGKPVVYDLDDNIGTCASEEMHVAMLNAASIVTTDTVPKSSFISFHTRNTIRVVPDSIDYWNEPPEFNYNKTLGSCITFGHPHSVEAALPFLLRIKNAFPDIVIKYVCSKNVLDGHGFEFIPWTQEIMKDELTSSDIAVVVTPKDVSGALRSNNRLIAAMASGIPTIAFNHSANRSTLLNADMDDMLFDETDIVNKIRKMAWNSYMREEVGKKGQNYAWEFFSPVKVSAMMKDVFEEALCATR